MIPASGAKTFRAPRKRFFSKCVHWVRDIEIGKCFRPAGQAVSLFLLTFVAWFDIPAAFSAAMLMMLPSKPSPVLLAGLAASIGMRALSGIRMDWWQYVGCLFLWGLRQKCQPKAGAETAALAGFAMMPRVLAAAAMRNPLDILLSCASVPVAMLAAAAFRFGADALRSSGPVLRGAERACLICFGLVVISGAGCFRIASVNLGVMLAVAAVLLYARVNGSVHGGFIGLLCGLSLVLGGHDSSIIIPLALSGLAAGAPALSRLRWMGIPAVLASDLLSWFLTGMDAPPAAWSAVLAGALLAALTPNDLVEKWKPYLRGADGGGRSMENAFVTQRIAQMREAIQNLAHALPQCGQELPTTGEELGNLLCTQCVNRETCWGSSRSRTEKMLSASMELARRGEDVTEENLPALAEHGCLRAERIAQLAHDECINRKRRSAAMQKARYERELTLTHLAALSGTLGELGAMTAGDSYNDMIAVHVIETALEELKIPARLSYARRVDGHLQAALEIQSVMPVQKQLDQLLRCLASAEGLALSIARLEQGRAELEEVPLYSASVGMASLCADGEKGAVCGDACSAKRCEGGRLLMMLCDGMGHGEQAHKQSEKTLELLLLLLEAGYTRHQAITAVNGMMLGVEETERFSTVDLVDIDLWTGEVYGEKLGACASWVVRGSHMKKIEGSSLPLGILREAAPTAAQYRLHSGDILVLISDGVADVFETDAQWKEMLEESIFIQPQRMADAILRNALLAAGGTPRDDMSVMVLLMMDRQQAG